MDTNIPDDYVPTLTEMEEIERVVLENDIFLIDSKDAKEEEEDPLMSLVNLISNLDKTQGDILTLLRSLNDHFNVIPKSPLESVHK